MAAYTPPARLIRRNATPATRQSVERELMRSSSRDIGHYAPDRSKLLRGLITENRRELVRRHHLELLECAVSGPLVVAPPPKLCGMSKSAALHVIVPKD